MATKTFDVHEFIDGQRLRPVHLGILALCFLVMFVDGFDIYMVGKIAPAIAKDFGIAPAAMTPVIVMQQIGLAVGAFLMSPLGDKLGRKLMLLIAFAMFGVLTIATAFSPSIIALAALRGITGLFLAAVLPYAVALISEFTPLRQRAMFLSAGMAGYSLGNVAGSMTALLVPRYGWEAGFLLGGAMPLALLPALAWALPESIAFRAARNPTDPAIARTIKRLAPNAMLTGEEHFVARTIHSGKARANPLDLFREGRGTISTLLFGACFFSMGTIALVAAWLPSFLQQMAGVSIQDFARSAMIGLLGGIVGMMSIGVLLDRVNRSIPIPIFFLGYSMAILLLGFVPFASVWFTPALFAMAFFQGGGQAGLNMTMARVYPTHIRSTGIGWAGGAGRIGGVVLPLFGGLALAQAFSLQITLAVVATFPLTVAVLVAFLSWALARSPIHR
ncbi:MFS transporter [Novosphingobium taihuense]|uniref:AAHS family 4-hydroxybenzoate transporter-like MFS transporter n=1 Tax=Novosphingobium taihuense TaxID=260085 RepID=A0A7W7AC41_9SPHN|nr:MFS transporter [Novosphingobium taihuense]MBB4614186.1 AAHS family 4-hydroxybenzoate transporter-like MFS transporter [Novosphingobium taihuense]TWH87035.1 AAHS family 4-hydroxybenzoate transporter-like MFS transporter [Novosphingobium taihuense]